MVSLPHVRIHLLIPNTLLPRNPPQLNLQPQAWPQWLTQQQGHLFSTEAQTWPSMALLGQRAWHGPAHRASSHVFAVPLSWVTVGFWDAILEKSTLPALQFSEVCKDGARDDGHFVLMSSYKWDTKLSIFIARLDTSKDGEQNCESHGARLLWEVKGFGPFWHFWQLSPKSMGKDSFFSHAVLHVPDMFYLHKVWGNDGGCLWRTAGGSEAVGH